MTAQLLAVNAGELPRNGWLGLKLEMKTMNSGGICKAAAFSDIENGSL